MTVHESSPKPSLGSEPPKCGNRRMIASFVSSSTPIMIAATAWTTVRAGSSTW